MSKRAIWKNISGTAAIEFAMTMPVFLMLLVGAVEFGLLMWTKLGLQHGVEMAARCATINSSTCGSSSNIQSYAVTQAYGLTLPTSTFTVSTPACGNQVQASYKFNFVTTYIGMPSLTITAKSCFPK
ncbi:MAG TPA: TadE/TadG family type IV pilus assembly protein [Rhizomicrobium sp.]|nr:TadE/TadG family type IV pilus assembly protein [Rhizomicrobium sp.]